MIFACGVSNYAVAIFHLANHAFFKALLFLGAGPVIHGVADEQDMRKMGGLRSEEHTSELQSLMRISYAVFCLNKKNLSFNTIHYLTQFSYNMMILRDTSLFENNTYIY